MTAPATSRVLNGKHCKNLIKTSAPIFIRKQSQNTPRTAPTVAGFREHLKQSYPDIRQEDSDCFNDADLTTVLDQAEQRLRKLANQAGPQANSNTATQPAPAAAQQPSTSAIVIPDDQVFSGEQLLNALEEFITRFIWFQHKSLYLLVALWIVGTYLYEEFDYYGYLAAFSAEENSGKTRVLEVTDLLADNSSGLLISPTEADLARTAFGSTQLLDEIDTWPNRDMLTAILNAGFNRRGTYRRLSKDENSGKYSSEKFSVFAPRALASIGLDILPRATRTRTFLIHMIPQKRSERREKLSWRKLQQTKEADYLKAQITAWATKHRQEMLAAYDVQNVNYLERFNDRTIDIARPLSAVLEVALSGSPLLTESRVRLLEAIAHTRKEANQAADHRLLKILMELASKAPDKQLIGSATELFSQAQSLAVRDGLEQFAPVTISKLLSDHGFETKSVRLNGGNAAYRYVLPHEKLADVLERHTRAETAL